MPCVPVAQQPLGMLQLVIKSVDLEQGSDSCFCLLRCGPLWGRSTTQPSSNHFDFSWEVHACLRRHRRVHHMNNMLTLFHLLFRTRDAHCCHLHRAGHMKQQQTQQPA